MKGRVWKYGDNVDTDAIIPARYLNVSTPEELAKHCMEDIDTSFAGSVQQGDIIVGGENFGCGSSREHAPLAIKGAGISCVIAKSFARIFYRNGINIGLPILECPQVVEETESGDLLTVDLEAGTITNERTGRTYQTDPFPAFIMAIIQADGLVPYTRQRIEAGRLRQLTDINQHCKKGAPMTTRSAEKVWLDGQLVDWDEATVHVAGHALHYGSSVFEGIRAYGLPDGPAVFRLEEHLDRLWDSCRIYRIEIPYDRQVIHQATLDTIRANKHKACYIRPLVFRGWNGSFHLDGRSCPTHVTIITVEMGKLLGEAALEGVDVGVSSWRRMAPDTYPAAAKVGGQYINSQLIIMEAVDHGYVEGIALDVNGYVCEGSGENIFVVRHGKLFTPPLANSILNGITRQCVLTLADELGLEVREEMVSREMLYLADEIFFCGTAAEITPIRSVDGIPVGIGNRGPIMTKIAEAFFDIVEGRVADRFGWLTPVS
jgi:branched-chain amino acid aminotransferase